MNIKGTIRYRVALKSTLFPPDTHTHPQSTPARSPFILGVLGYTMTIQEANTQMDGASKANTDTEN